MLTKYCCDIFQTSNLIQLLPLTFVLLARQGGEKTAHLQQYYLVSGKSPENSGLTTS